MNLAPYLAAPVAVGGVLYTAAIVTLTRMAMSARPSPINGTPADWGMPFENVAFASSLDDIPLRGWFVPAGPTAVVLLHGFGTNRAGPDGKAISVLRDYHDAGISVLAYDLRGQGESGGRSIGAGWLDRYDVRSALSWLKDRGFPAGGIGIHGWSYGGACAILAAAEHQDVAAVFADSAFANVADLIDVDLRLVTGRNLPPIFRPGISQGMRWLYGVDPDTMSPERAIGLIAPRPISLIHGENDAVVPVSHAHRLLEAANNPRAELWIAPGAAHCEAYSIFKEESIGRAVKLFSEALVA